MPIIYNLTDGYLVMCKQVNAPQVGVIVIDDIMRHLPLVVE